ncbi:MAG: Acetyltransferase domain [Candidatus Parcubacteria bacterium]|jgi:GNAT superfamily N-acetyltransferase
MQEIFGSVPVQVETHSLPGAESLRVSKPDLWRSMGDEYATLFAGNTDFSYASESSYWYMLFRGFNGEMRSLVSVVEPRYSADTLTKIAGHLRQNLGVTHAGYFLRETVVRAMETRNIGKKLAEVFEDPLASRIHMAMNRSDLAAKYCSVQRGITIERVVEREALEEAVALSELGENGESMFRGIRKDFGQVETIGVYLMRDEEGKPLSTTTLVRNHEIASVWNMATHPDERSKGHGGRLLRIALQQPDFRNASVVHLLAMPKAVSFYERQGFTQTERAVYVG